MLNGGPPSVFAQGEVTLIERSRLMPQSPRNYNASVCDHGGRRWLAYRSHRIDQAGRCAIALCELDAAGQPKGKSQWLALPVARGIEHQEDPRLFLYQGALHLSFTETEFHPPDRPYTCVIKYCRLGRKGKAWAADGPIWQPKYGRNDGLHQEKNWQFFDDRGTLRVIYEAEPHRILELKGDRVVHEDLGPARMTAWPWGTIRGGTPPVRTRDGLWLTFFHSATWHPEPPHWRRYYSGAYLFEPEAPWRIVKLSQEPLLTGSAEDGHAMDPRNIDSWKPFVVFPCGAVAAEGPAAHLSLPRPSPTKLARRPAPAQAGWLVSYGVNDHLTALVRHTDLKLGAPDFSDWATRFFKTENASLPVRNYPDERSLDYLAWQPVGRLCAGTRAGVMHAANPRVAQLLEDNPLVTEIDRGEFLQLGGKIR